MYLIFFWYVSGNTTSFIFGLNANVLIYCEYVSFLVMQGRYLLNKSGGKIATPYPTLVSRCNQKQLKFKKNCINVVMRKYIVSSSVLNVAVCPDIVLKNRL